MLLGSLFICSCWF